MLGAKASLVTILCLALLAWLLYNLLVSERTLWNCLQCGRPECPVAAQRGIALARVDEFPAPEFIASVANALALLVEVTGKNEAYPPPPESSLLTTLRLSTEPSLGVVLQNRRDGSTWILLRGSHELLDWYHDARQNQRPFDFGGAVHYGFLTIYRGIQLQVMEKLPAGVKDVVLSGHSMGAAVATLLALAIGSQRPRARVTLVTFACPRVGDQAFCDAVDLKVPRHVTLRNDADVIPTLPTAVTPNYHNPFRPFVYGRCGRTILFEKNCKALTRNHYIDVYLEAARAAASAPRSAS